MGIFKKKDKQKDKKKNEETESLTLTTSKSIRIILISRVGDTPVQEDSFIAQLQDDPIDKVTYMVNEEHNFKELYPTRDSKFNFVVKGDNIAAKKKWLNMKIQDLRKKLKEYPNNSTKKFNEKDLELQIKIYENRLIELQRGIDSEQGSAMYIGSKGLRTFFFNKTAGELIPIRWFLDGNTIYKDIAYKKKQSVVAYQNLMFKYSSKIRKRIETSMIWLMLILIVWTIGLLVGSGYLFNKYHSFSTMYDNASITKLKLQSEQSILWCSDVLKKQLGVVQNLTELNKKNLELQSKFITQPHSKLTG